MTKYYISDLSGVVTLTRKGGVKLLRAAYSQSVPQAFVTLGNNLDIFKRGGKENQSYRSTKSAILETTILKKVSNVNFKSEVNLKTYKEVTGKMPTVKNGKVVSTITQEEEILCHMADWAYMAFGSLAGVTVTLSLLNGNRKITKSF